MEEELYEDPKEDLGTGSEDNVEEENDESGVDPDEDMEEEIEEEQEDLEVEPEKDLDQIMEQDLSKVPEGDPDVDPLEEDFDEDPSEDFDEDLEEDLAEEDPEEDVPQLNSNSVNVPDNKQRPDDGTLFQFSPSQVYESKEKCNYKKAFQAELSFHSIVCQSESACDKEEPLGRSGKQRRSRWEPQVEQDGKLDVLDINRKRRKTRWDVTDTQPMPNSFKDFTNNQFDPAVHRLRLRLIEITSTLQASNLCDVRREVVRLRRKLNAERKRIVAKLSKEKHLKFSKKLFIPIKEYPTYNFAGLIIGPKGNTIRRMEKKTGAKIMLRGKGSMKSQVKVDPSDDEDLHVHIKATSKKILDVAVMMVEKLLVPIDDQANEHKLAQLKELAKLRGNYVDENTCRVCWEQGHKAYACPQKPSTLQVIIPCNASQSLSHLTSGCSYTASSKVSIPPQNFMPDAIKNPKREIDNSNLYVGCLPNVVDDSHLRELFSPFGKIFSCRVIRDKSTGISKGHGFIKFEDAMDAATALMHMKQYEMDGHILTVRIAGTEPQMPVLPALAPLLPYPRPAPLYPGDINQAAWPDQPSLTYHGHVNQYPSVGSTNMTPHSFIPGLKESKAEPSSPDLLEKFPGDPDHPGSEFKSYFTMRPL